MTIEKILERIATSLETIAANGVSLNESLSQLDPATDTPPPAAEDKKSSGARGKDKVVGNKPEDEEEETEYTKEDVRAALQGLQKEVNQAAAKSVLKICGATTVGGLAKSKYGQCIDLCKKQIDEA